MNKNGFIGWETLVRIIVALLFLTTGIFLARQCATGLLQDNQETKNSFTQLKDKINQLGLGEKENFVLPLSKENAVIGFSNTTSISQFRKLSECGEECICLCEKVIDKEVGTTAGIRELTCESSLTCEKTEVSDNFIAYRGDAIYKSDVTNYELNEGKFIYFEDSRYKDITLTRLSNDLEVSTPEEKEIEVQFSASEINQFLENNAPKLSGLGQCIKKTAENTGVPAEIILSVALHESGDGNSALASGLCPTPRNSKNTESNNLFGVKSTTNEKSCEWKTYECLTQQQKQKYENQNKLIRKARANEFKCGETNKEAYRVWDRFKRYDTKCQSIRDFAALIQAEYSQALTSQNIDTIIERIREEGYSTDPRWSNKIIAQKDEIETNIG